jgi:hypothetical protein
MARKTEHQVRPASHASEPDGDIRVELGALDYLAPRQYMDMVLVFEVDEGHVDIITDILQASLAKALSHHRVMAGRVRIDEATNTPWVAVCKDDSVSFTVQKDPDSVPPYRELEEADFAQELFNPEILLPGGGLGHNGAATKAGKMPGQPATAYQLSVIRGGVILVVTWHHSVADAAGIRNFLSQWAEKSGHCLNGSPAMDDIAFGRSFLQSQNRSPTKTDELRSKDSRSRMCPIAGNSTASGDWRHPPMRHVIWHFPRSKCRQLKEQHSLKAGDVFASSHDAILALVYKCAVRSRLGSVYNAPRARSNITIAVDVRGRTGSPVPPRYLGNAIYYSQTPELENREVLVDQSLPRIVGMIREAINQASAENVDELVEGADEIEDKSRISMHVGAFARSSLLVINWADVKAYSMDFGFGRPKALRYGNPLASGVVLFYPERPKKAVNDEGVEVLISLERASMRELLRDEEMWRWSSARGIPPEPNPQDPS